MEALLFTSLLALIIIASILIVLEDKVTKINNILISIYNEIKKE